MNTAHPRSVLLTFANHSVDVQMRPAHSMAGHLLFCVETGMATVSGICTTDQAEALARHILAAVETTRAGSAKPALRLISHTPTAEVSA